MNWASAELIANIDKIILEDGFDCKVKLIPGATMPTFTEMNKNKKPLMSPESWSNAFYTQLKKAVAKGRMHVANESPISDITEGWFITPATAKKYPNLKTVLDVIDNPDLFGGKFIGCPAGWRCKIMNNNLFKAFNMKKKGWTIVDPGSAAGLDASIAKAANNNKNWFGYYWNPTAVVGKYNMVKLDWGVSWAGRENWDNCISRENCSNPIKTSWTSHEVYSVVTDRFKNNAGSKVMNYLNNRTIPVDVMNNMLVYMGENDSNGKDAAKEFLKRNQEIWTNWVSYEVAKNIGNSVGITMIAKAEPSQTQQGTKKKPEASNNDQASLDEERRKIEEEKKKIEEEKRKIAEAKKKREEEEKKRKEANAKLYVIGSGTGFFVSSSGHAVSNEHVVGICRKVATKIDGENIFFNILKTDQINDLGLIKGDYRSPNFLSIKSDGAEFGEDIVAFGYPLRGILSSSVKLTRGIVSSLSGLNDNYSEIQIDAAIQPGNSGGPVLNMEGQVVGVASSGLNKLAMIEEAEYIPENVNFAVAAPTLHNFLKSNGVNTKNTPLKINNTKELAKIGRPATIQLFCLNTKAKHEELKNKKKHSDVLLEKVIELN